MDMNTFGLEWAQGKRPNGKCSSILARDGKIYSFGEHFLLAMRHGEHWFYNSYNWGARTSRHQSAVRSAICKVSGNMDKVVFFSSRSPFCWWGSGQLPGLGHILGLQISQQSGNWKGTSDAVKAVYPDQIDATTGRIKSSLWNGDTDKLRKVLLGSGYSSVEEDYTERCLLTHVLVDEGLEEGMAYWRKHPKHLTDATAFHLLLSHGATELPKGALKGWYGQAMDKIMSAPDRVDCAVKLLLSKRKETLSAANTWLNNFNNHKGVHT